MYKIIMFFTVIKMKLKNCNKVFINIKVLYLLIKKINCMCHSCLVKAEMSEMIPSEINEKQLFQRLPGPCK